MNTQVLTRRPSLNIFPTEEEIRAYEIKMFLMVLPFAGITVIDSFLGIFRVMVGRNFVDPNVRGGWHNFKRFFQYKWKYFWEDDFRRTVEEYKAKAREVGNLSSDKLNYYRERLAQYQINEADVLAGVQFMAAMSYIGYITFLVGYSVLALAGLGTYGAWRYYSVPNAAPVPVVEKQIVYTPQEADVQDANYGPWFNRGEVLGKVKDPSFLNMAKVDDTGTIQYSKSLIATTDGFKPLVQTERIINPKVTPDGQISFHDQESNTFTINPFQVFIFEGYKSKAFYFDKEAKIYGIDPKELKITQIK